MELTMPWAIVISTIVICVLKFEIAITYRKKND